MATLAALRDNVRRLLEDSPSRDQLDEALDATETTVTVDTGSKFSANTRLEVDSEVMLVTAVSGNDLTVVRGHGGTTAATHADDAEVRINPRFLTANLNEAINVVLTSWCTNYFPRLVWDTTTAGTFLSNTWIYEAPSDALTVEKVVWNVPGYTAQKPVSTTGLNTYDTDTVASGLGFEVYDMGLPGHTVRVLYGKIWPELTTDASETVSDFPSNAIDLITNGAMIYLSGMREVPKWRVDEVVSHQERNQVSPPSFSNRWLQIKRQEWRNRALDISKNRPQSGKPRKVYRGLN